MQQTSSILPAKLSDRPNVEDLEAFVRRARDERGDLLGRIVLFGSMARGNYSFGSDFDVLVGLRGDQAERFIDRLADWGSLSPRGYVEPFVYTRSELHLMAENGHHLLSETARDGIILHDGGLRHEVARRLNS